MSTQTPNRQEVTDPSRIRRMAQLGIDAEGREHYWLAPRQTLFVLDGDAVAHVETIDDRPLSEWVAFIEESCGWTDLFWSAEPAFEQLMRRLREAVE